MKVALRVVGAAALLGSAGALPALGGAAPAVVVTLLVAMLAASLTTLTAATWPRLHAGSLALALLALGARPLF